MLEFLLLIHIDSEKRNSIWRNNISHDAIHLLECEMLIDQFKFINTAILHSTNHWKYYLPLLVEAFGEFSAKIIAKCQLMHDEK